MTSDAVGKVPTGGELANGRIWVGDAKTEAGIRLVDILPALRDELLSHRHTNANAAHDALVFPTSSGSRRDKDNARERVIRAVVRMPTRCSPGAAASRLRPA